MKRILYGSILILLFALLCSGCTEKTDPNLLVSTMGNSGVNKITDQTLSNLLDISFEDYLNEWKLDESTMKEGKITPYPYAMNTIAFPPLQATIIFDEPAGLNSKPEYIQLTTGFMEIDQGDSFKNILLKWECEGEVGYSYSNIKSEQKLAHMVCEKDNLAFEFFSNGSLPTYCEVYIRKVTHPVTLKSDISLENKQYFDLSQKQLVDYTSVDFKLLLSTSREQISRIYDVDPKFQNMKGTHVFLRKRLERIPNTISVLLYDDYDVQSADQPQFVELTGYSGKLYGLQMGGSFGDVMDSWGEVPIKYRIDATQDNLKIGYLEYKKDGLTYIFAMDHWTTETVCDFPYQDILVDTILIGFDEIWKEYEDNQVTAYQ